MIVDGVTYDVIITSIDRSFSLKQGGQGGTAQTGREILDIIGTDYVYNLKIEPNKDKYSDYDSFYDAITAPVECHTITVPYGQTTITFDAIILSGKDRLKRKVGTSNRWGGLSLQFVPIEPWTASPVPTTSS